MRGGALGVPLQTVEHSVDYGSGRTEGYRLARRDFYLPYLRLLSEAGGEADDASPSDDAFLLEDDEVALAADALQERFEPAGDVEPCGGSAGDGPAADDPTAGGTERPTSRLWNDSTTAIMIS